jgi:CRISPR-associated protein Csb1
VEGERGVLFPPTYASDRQGEPGKYNIDRIGDPDKHGVVPAVPNVCLVDSVGSQANRIEPAFDREIADGALVPRVTITFEDGDTISLLDAGHRVADAVVRFSDLIDDSEVALLAYRDDADATTLAKIAPTSLVFGAWDSRATQVKLPRVVAATIRAYDVHELRRSAQYNPPKDYILDGAIDDPGKDKAKKDRYSEEGLLDAPATFTHGGIIAEGDIRREASLNLATIRDLRAGDDDTTRALQRYILGLSLVAVTHLDGKSMNLRQGCQLVGNGPAHRKLVMADGSEQAFDLTAADAVTFAKAAAAAFGVGEDRTASFDKKAAANSLKKTSEEAKKARAAKAARAKREVDGE